MEGALHGDELNVKSVFPSSLPVASLAVAVSIVVSSVAVLFLFRSEVVITTS